MASDFTPDALPRVLIVDDDPKNLLVLETVLTGDAYQLVKATTGPDALLALMNGEFATLVLDVQMPDMSGIELAKMIKLRKRTQHIPIIFLTAHYREDEHAVLGYDVGAVDYLTKPVNPAVLRSKVNVFVDLFSKTRDLKEMHRAAQIAEEALRVANSELASRNKALEGEADERERRIRAEAAQAKAEEANAAKDRFLAMLSHELRTPLSPIMNAVALLEDSECSPAIRESIDTIRRNVRLEARLIDDLLDLARIHAGKLRLDLQAVNVYDILQHALEICRPDFESRRIRVSTRLDSPQQNLHSLADPARLLQIFWNLLANASKFSPEGSMVEVRIFDADDDVVTEIADQGRGIAPDMIDRIFEAFEQGTGKRQGGLGLGLAICKELVSMHGGSIEARSEGVNRGATFNLHLRRVFPEISDNSVASDVVPNRGDLRLLIVEDHADTLATLERLLKRRGYSTRTASSIAEALEVAREYEFDVLLSDIGLPDGEGTELLRRFQKEHGWVPPSIAMSGFGMEEDRYRSQQAGFAEHLTKPVEIFHLEQAIGRLMLKRV